MDQKMMISYNWVFMSLSGYFGITIKNFPRRKKPSYMVDMVGSFFINKLYLLKTGKKTLNIYLYLKIFISSF